MTAWLLGGGAVFASLIVALRLRGLLPEAHARFLLAVVLFGQAAVLPGAAGLVSTIVALWLAWPFMVWVGTGFSAPEDDR